MFLIFLEVEPHMFLSMFIGFLECLFLLIKTLFATRRFASCNGQWKKKRTSRIASHFPFLQSQKRENLIPASVLFGEDVKVVSLLVRQRNLPLKSSLRQQSNEEILCGLENSARVVWHLPCYASYTSARNTRSAIKSLQTQISDIESDCSKGNEGCRLFLYLQQTL